MVEEEKDQKEGKRSKRVFFPLAGLLGAAAGPILGEITKLLFKKIALWEEKQKAVRQNILLRRRTTPRRIRLPNGQSFLARYERVSRRNLPRNVTIKQTRQIGPRNRRTRKAQKGGSLFEELAKLGVKLGAKTLFKKGVSAGSKTLSSEIGKKLIDEGIKHAPDIYRFGTSKIRNKDLKRALESDAYIESNYIVQETQKK